MEFIAAIIAAVAMALQPQPLPPDFKDAIARCERAIVQPGTFIGCATPDGDETLYAGLVWIDGQVSPETGP